MEKWKKYLIFSIGFSLLDFYIGLTIGWSDSDVQGRFFYVFMHVIPGFAFLLALDNWREIKGKKNPVFKFNWKRVTLYFFVFAIASYLFAIYLYLYPGTVFTIEKGQVWSIGALIFGTVCLLMAFYIVWHRVRLTEELYFR